MKEWSPGLKIPLGLCGELRRDEGNTHRRTHARARTHAQSSAIGKGGVRDTCLLVWIELCCAKRALLFTAHLEPCGASYDSFEKKKKTKGGELKLGILVTWSELLSSFNPPTPLHPTAATHPSFQYPSPSRAHSPGAHAECSVRRVSTERPLCVLTKAECPGDKRGRSGLRAHKSQGEEKGGRRTGGGSRDGQSAKA